MSLTIFLTTWNTGLQGSKAQSQDLTSWLLPVLQNTSADLPKGRSVIPDIYAIGVQELLPVHLALAGLSMPLLLALTERIQNLLGDHASSLSEDKKPEKYSLISRIAHGGNALWLFARDSTTKRKFGKPLTAKLGLYYGGMSNKGAVGIRVPIQRGEKDDGWEVLTFVCTHLEAHDHNIPRRNAQYRHILSSLIFQPSDPLMGECQITDTSHLFLLGDLNYRLSRLPKSGRILEGKLADDILALEKERAEMVDVDTLRREQREGRVFGGLREGDLSRFAPTYKRIVGKVEGYSKKRIPGYTDRILFASHTDPPHLFSPEASLTPQPAHAPDTTEIISYSATPSLTLSDHKPVHAVLILPPPSHTVPAAHLAPNLPTPPSHHGPIPAVEAYESRLLRRIVGALLDKSVGWPATIFAMLGAGNPVNGMGVAVVLLVAVLVALRAAGRIQRNIDAMGVDL